MNLSQKINQNSELLSLFFFINVATFFKSHRKLFVLKFLGNDNKVAEYVKQIEEKIKIRKSQMVAKNDGYRNNCKNF
jgi:hypothetical protein